MASERRISAEPCELTPNQPTVERETMIQILDDAAKRLRALERAQLYIDGGASWKQFWEEGNAIFELLKSMPFVRPS